MNVYLVRHTRVAVESGICYGHADVPLAASFQSEAESVRQKLPALHGFSVYSSPLTRCQQLAEFLRSDQRTLDSRLMELNFGDWEQRRWDQLDANQLKHWSAYFVEHPCPGGESYRDLYRRAAAFWEELAAVRPEQAVIITHGGFIRATLSYLLDIPLEKSLRIGVDFGSVTKIHLMEEMAIVDYVNH